MTDYSKRIFEMLVRVLVFRLTHKDLIGKDSQADQLFEKGRRGIQDICAIDVAGAREKRCPLVRSTNGLRRSRLQI